MSDRAGSPTVAVRTAFTAGAVLDAWRSVTREQLRAAFTFGCAALFYQLIVWSHRMVEAPSPLRSLAGTFIHDQLGAFILMLAVVVADRASGTPGRRRTAYLVAVIVSALISAPLGSVIAQSIAEPRLTLGHFVESTIYTFSEWVILSGAAVFVYADRRRARAARARMHAAELERFHAARRTLESRLQAMQAQVEPRFLFSTLAQVRDLYRRDAALGALMLDELIAYLRAAMPAMRDSSSTLGQEVELVRAWIGIAQLRLGEGIGFTIELPEALRTARMPPMMLLPLVDRVIARGGRSLRLQVTGTATQRRIVLAGSGVGDLEHGEELAAVRERLTALFRADARVDFVFAGESAEMVLAMPADAGVNSQPIASPANAWAATDAAEGRAA